MANGKWLGRCNGQSAIHLNILGSPCRYSAPEESKGLDSHSVRHFQAFVSFPMHSSTCSRGVCSARLCSRHHGRIFVDELRV